MSIEIRELVIKTEVETSNEVSRLSVSKLEIDNLKNELLESCKRMVSDSMKRKAYNR